MIDEEAATVVRDLATAATKPHKLELGEFYALLTTGGMQKVDLTGDEYQEFPKRKTGIVTVRNVASFGAYWDRHHDDDSEVFADLDRGTVTAVLDAHRGNNGEDGGLGADEGARWQQHRLILALQPTRPWLDWTGHDRKWMLQEPFAEFIEEHNLDIDPRGKVSAMDLFESAQHFKAALKTSFTSAIRLKDGRTQFECVEEVESAGRTGTERRHIEMPNEFDLAIRPYEDAETDPVAVRLRYRIGSDKKLVLGYFMNDPARVAREAVAEVVAKLGAECSVTVMHGCPA